MPTYEVTAPDGRTFEVTAPEGATKSQVLAYAQRNYAASPKKQRGFFESVSLGADSVINNLAGRVVSGLDAVGLAPDSLKQEQAANDARFAAAMPETSTAGRVVGEALPTLATLPIKGGMAVQGALSGAMLSQADTPGGVAKDAFVGGATSLGVGTALKVGASLAKPVVSAGAAALRDAGVPMTLGQIAGLAESDATGLGKVGAKAVRGIEERLAGLPVVGDVINAARDRSTIGYNQAVLNRALSAVNENLPANVAPGRDSVRYVGDKLSEAYNALLPSLSATVDRRFKAGVARAFQGVQTIADDKQAQFQKILVDAFGNRASGGTLSGRALKDAEEKLRDQAAAYRSSGDVDQRRMGEALGQVRDELRALIERSNPAKRGELQRLNRGWRELAIIEGAAGGQGNTSGLFTPKGYAAAARKADTSVRKRATTRGTMPNQTLTDAAAGALPNATPESGTAGRAALFLAGSGAGLGALANPYVAVPAAAAALPYTGVGQRAANALLLGKRPAAVESVARPLNALSRFAPQVAAPVSVYSQK